MDHQWTNYAKRTLVPTPFKGLRVLLVDHDATALLDIASVLEEHSYRVTTVELATTALAVLHKGSDQFDLVMADVNMTEMDAFAFLKVMQVMEDIPIILMSSREDRDMVRKAWDEGVCFVLHKPISTEQLKNVWQHVYRKRIMCAKVELQNKDTEEKSGMVVDDPDEGVVARGNAEPISKNVRAKDKKFESDDQVGLVNVEFVGELGEVGGGSKRKRKRNVSEGIRERERRGNSYIEWNGKDKDAEREMEDMYKEDLGSSGKKWRMRWTPDLHSKFKEALSALGENACPKKVLEMMNVPHITPRQVASHLQKYRVQLKRAREALESFSKYEGYGNGGVFRQPYQQDNVMNFHVPQVFNSESANTPGVQNPLFGGNVLRIKPTYSAHAGLVTEAPRVNEVQDVSSNFLNINDIERSLKLIESPTGNNSFKF